MSITLVLVLVVLGYFSFVFLAESVNPFRRPVFRETRKRLRLGRQVGLLIAGSSMTPVLLPADTLPTGSLIVQLQYCLFLVSPVVIVLLVKHFIWRRQTVRTTKKPRGQVAAQSVTGRKIMPSENTWVAEDSALLRKTEPVPGDRKPPGVTQGTRATPAASQRFHSKSAGVDKETGDRVTSVSVFDEVSESELIE